MKLARTATLAFLVVLAFILVFFAWPARGHTVAAMKYPSQCCGGAETHGDCAPLEGVGVVTRHFDGWFIQETGETIPFGNTRPSDDLRFHRCKKADNTTRCFFAPESGT